MSLWAMLVWTAGLSLTKISAQRVVSLLRKAESNFGLISLPERNSLALSWLRHASFFRQIFGESFMKVSVLGGGEMLAALNLRFVGSNVHEPSNVYRVRAYFLVEGFILMFL